MKILIYLMTVLVSGIAFGQVGIGTETPRDQLDVNGGLLIDNYLILDQTNNATGSQLLLVRSDDSTPVGEVKLLDVDIRDVGPINKYNVRIDDVDNMSVFQLNTNLDVSKYYLGLAEAVYVGINSNNTSQTAHIQNANTSGNPIHGTYYTSVDNTGSTYKVSLSFNNATTQQGRNGYWLLSFIVFEKVLVKDWGTFTGSVTSANSYTGASTNTPLGLQ